MVLAESKSRIFEPKEAKSFNSLRTVVDVPNLVQVQINSFEDLKTAGLRDLFEEISPIEDFSGGRFELRFLDHEIREPKFTERECRQREITYSSSATRMRGFLSLLITRLPCPARRARASRPSRS